MCEALLFHVYPGTQLIEVTSYFEGKPQQTIDRSKVTVKQQPTNHCSFYIM